MKERIVVGYTLKSPFENAEFFKGADLVLVGHRAFKTVSYKREIEGLDDLLVRLGRFSNSLNCPLLVGMKTDNYGLLKRSVAIFDKGKLVALSDAVSSQEENESPSFGFKVLKFSGVKIGFATGKDLRDIDCLKALVLCESDVIINLYADFYDFSLEKLNPTVSYLFGTSTVSLSGDFCVSSTGKGNVAFSSKEERGKFLLPINRKFVEVKRKVPWNF